MLGSVPMALDELALAPAMLSAKVKSRGYKFKFLDINLSLFEHCDSNQTQYQEKVELLQNLVATPRDTVVDRWTTEILSHVSQSDYLLVNVFSQYSHGVAFKIIQLVKQHYPDISIIIGGIGGQKLVGSLENIVVKTWIENHFEHCQSLIFGELLLNNGYICGWQTDTTMSEIDRLLPQKISQYNPMQTMDFSVYNLDRYQWPASGRSVPILGSHGCVRQCSFCDVIKHYPKYSFVEADQLTQQIVDVYQQTGISKFIFMDSLVNGSMSNFESLLKNLIHSKQQGWLPEDFSWSGTYICRPRSTQLDRIHLLLRESGVDNLVIGVETGSDRIRFEMEKKFTNKDLLYELTAFAQHNIKAQLLFFPAWPTETNDDFKETIQLLTQLAPLSQQGTVSASFGMTGFTLVDGTPIYQTKHQIGLVEGPLSFLWRCDTNPDLNFWETLRRRLAITAVADHYGILYSREDIFLRFLTFNLQHYHDTILEYASPLDQTIVDSSIYNNLNNNHQLTMTVINSGTLPIELNISTDDNQQHWTCGPGFTDISWKFSRQFELDQNFCISIKFGPDYQPQWVQHPNGEYYSKNGIYLDNIYIDNKNITLWGFNQLVSQKIINPLLLPVDYYTNINQRCVAVDTELSWKNHKGIGTHNHLTRILSPEMSAELDRIRQRIKKLLSSYRF